MFTHNIERIKSIYKKLMNNYPQLQILDDKLEIFICPKPSLGFENAHCYGSEIVLYPRPTQIPNFMTDYIVVHEIGHFISNHLCKNGKENELWREYLTLRNAPRGNCEIYVGYDEIKEESIYETQEDFLCLNGTPEEKKLEWNENPVEWFAEDFRYLFGVDTGEPYWGMSVCEPDEKVKEFFNKLK